jgi:hypothetical protein
MEMSTARRRDVMVNVISRGMRLMGLVFLAAAMMVASAAPASAQTGAASAALN